LRSDPIPGNKCQGPLNSRLIVREFDAFGKKIVMHHTPLMSMPNLMLTKSRIIVSIYLGIYGPLATPWALNGWLKPIQEGCAACGTSLRLPDLAFRREKSNGQ
jgi:hypothetical protein